MKSASVYATLQPSPSYKLIELPPSMMELMAEGSDTLVLKSSPQDASIVLCTSSSTFKVRQKNHSNTMLVMNHELSKNRLVSFASLSSILEITATEGRIYVDKIPIYYGSEQDFKEVKEPESVAQVKARSPISNSEFEESWARYSGCEINGQACLLSSALVSSSLKMALGAIVGHQLALDELHSNQVTEIIDDKEITTEIVTTILRKFSSTPQEPFTLNNEKIALWFGIECLKRFGTRIIEVEEFLIEWKSEFPSFFSCNIELSQLYGYFVRPLPNKIQYLSKDSLPLDASSRFKSLFKIQSTWELTEFVPFIKDINIRNLKTESFIMKYAKIKKVGKKTIITSR